VPVFIELTTDNFADTFNKQKGASDRARRAGTNNARRPTRGLEVKDDTFALIKVVDSTGQEIPLIDSSSPNGLSTQYTNFILQRVKEARMEKNQIIETFGDSYIYFFGEAPRFLDVQAVLVDSQDFNWYAEWWANWDENFRGTKSVEKGARTYLFYDDNIVEGYMLMASAEKVSESPLMVQLTWRMFLTNYTNISFVGDPNFPVRGSVMLPAGVTDVNQFTQNEGALDATLAANLQTIGFGGGSSLIQALQQGLSPGSIAPGLQGIVNNAAEAFGGVGGQMPPGLMRQAQLRSLISDNTDEYTGTPPSAVNYDNGYDPTLDDEVQEAWDLAAQTAEVLQAYGASFFAPSTMNQLGIGPRFGSAGIGIGISAGVGARATFGATVGGGASFGARAGASAGIGGGFGFSGRVGASTGFGTGFSSVNGGFSSGGASFAASGSQLGDLVNQLNAASFQDVLSQNFSSSQFGGSGNFNNGVQVGGGLSTGVGIAGGVSGGIGASSSFTAGVNATAGASAGIGGGASLNVGGTPSAFSMVSMPGTLTPNGFSISDSSFARSTL
jgi:hypothetical protein